MKIDMGWPGPLGTDVVIRNRVVYIGGTNHWLEWLHHVTPGAARRERRWARELVEMLDLEGFEFDAIAGHSVGGAVACGAAKEYRGRGVTVGLYTYGAKRPPRDWNITGQHIAIKGDVVPLLPPWRPSLNLIVMDYGKLSWREAHGPRSYYEQMKKDGVR